MKTLKYIVAILICPAMFLSLMWVHHKGQGREWMAKYGVMPRTTQLEGFHSAYRDGHLFMVSNDLKAITHHPNCPCHKK